MIKIKWRDGSDPITFSDNYGTRPRVEFKDGVAEVTDANQSKHWYPLDRILCVYEDTKPRGF